MSVVNTPVLDIVDSMLSSNFLAKNFKAIYARYICVDKMMMKNEGVLPLLMGLAIDVPVVKRMRITHLDDLDLYTATEKQSFS